MGKIGICTTYAEILDTVLDRPNWAFRWYHKARLALHADSKQDPNTAWFFELPELRTLARLERHEDVVARAPHCLDCLRASFNGIPPQEGELLSMMAAAMLQTGRATEARDLLTTNISRLEKVESGLRTRVLMQLAEAEIRAGTSGGATDGMREAFMRLDEAERELETGRSPDLSLPIQLKATRALALITSGKVQEGTALRREAREQALRTIGPEHPLSKALSLLS